MPGSCEIKASNKRRAAPLPISSLIIAIIALALAACSGSPAAPTTIPTDAATPVPSSTGTTPPTETPATRVYPTLVPSLTPPNIVQIEVEAAEGQSVPAPLTLNLPEGWGSLHDTVAIQDLGTGLQVLPFSAYIGPVTGGQGFIIVLWGFRTIAPGSPGSERAGQFNLGFDGRRLLTLAVTDLGCIVGGFTDLDYDRQFRIGDQFGLGSYFSAVNCPASADTRGWFAGLNHQGVNFVFYAYTEPIGAMDGPAEAELQAILDTVQFTDIQPVVDQLIPTAVATLTVVPETEQQAPAPIATFTPTADGGE